MNLDKLLNPKKIALVGANEKDSFGGNTARNLARYGNPDDIYFVNPGRETALGWKCWPSIASLPENIDQVIIATPMSTVPGLLREAAAKGAKSAVLFASGYGETGTPEGKAAEAELKDLCRELDLALMGPNCAGFINYIDGIYSFSFVFEERDRRGGVGMVSQSGQIALTAMDSPNMKMSYAISAGNNTVTTMEDYLDFLVDDPKTKVVAMFLEGVTQPEKMAAALARAAEKRKPVVIFKVGKSEKGAAAAASHTGSLAGADAAFDAVFEKFGVIRCGDLQELLTASLTLATWPELPKGSRLSVMNLSGGETGICADMGHECGVEFPDFEPETLAKLRQMLPSYATPNNPLDMTASLSYDADKYGEAFKTVMDDPNVDVVVIGYTMLLEIADPAIHYMAEGIEKVLKGPGPKKPTVMLPFIENTRNPEYQEKLSAAGVPILPPPAYGFKVLKRLTDFAAYKPAERSLTLARPSRPLGSKRVTLSEFESMKLLREFGIATPAGGLAATAEEAARLAESIAGPVVLKVASADIPHKTDAGGVRLRLEGRAAVTEAFEGIMKSCRAYKPEAVIDGVFVQEMLKPGLEVILGVNNDPQFGSMVLCGLGGVFVEIFKDTALYPAPLDENEAMKMLKKLKAWPMFTGYRGQKPLDAKALTKTIAAVGRLAVENKDRLVELDINPLFVYSFDPTYETG
ncbi:acetate--CoA ligase family protein [Deltaproteobacteria bacterium OttesenSCG-928-K17]|nr:acetate--CoA ligase family protein [Deltaproteobacteria bacterium OttesenSCG-928-K17]